MVSQTPQRGHMSADFAKGVTRITKGKATIWHYTLWLYRQEACWMCWLVCRKKGVVRLILLFKHGHPLVANTPTAPLAIVIPINATLTDKNLRPKT